MLRSRYNTLLARVQHLEDTHPGMALRRLRSLARVPTPDFTGESATFPGEEFLQVEQYRGFTGEQESVHLDEELRGLSNDVRLLEHELTHRLLSGMSRASLLKRYASRCEQFDATSLRALCDKAKGRAEADLTWHAAKYFYDQGLNLLVDAPHAGRLRPDLFDPKLGPSLYIECKQYKDAPADAMRGINQTWNTWARLDKQFPTQEAFLLVFRRGGQTIEPPYLSAEHEGRRIHFILVDIGESKESGSRTKTKPRALTKAMLLPEAEEQ